MARKKTEIGDMSNRLNIKKKKKTIQPESSRTDDQKSVSYRLGLDTRERISRAAEQFGVQKSELARYLLNIALDQLEAGEITIQTVEVEKPKKIVF